MKFLADENFDNRIVRGLLRRRSDIDIVRVQDLEIAGSDDPTVLAWAARKGRVLLTHDEKTIPLYAYERLAEGETIAGVVVASDNLSIGSVIENILLIMECSSSRDWIGQVQRLPL